MKDPLPEKAVAEATEAVAVVGLNIMPRLGPGLEAPDPGLRLGLPLGREALRLRLQTQGMPAKSADYQNLTGI